MTQPAITLTEPIGDSSKPLLVLAHSLGTGILIWEKVAPLLNPHFQISLLSLPGHGSAPVPDAPFTIAQLATATADAVRQIATGGVFFAGVSIGGALGLQLALDHSDLFAAVAVISSAASLGSSEHWTQRAAFVREQSTSALVASSAQSWFGPDSIENEPELTGRILRALQEVSSEGYALCAEALGSYDLRNSLSRIHVPILAMGGEYDTIAPENRQDEIVLGVENGQKIMIGDAAHQPPSEQPERVAAALLNFFEGVKK